MYIINKQKFLAELGRLLTFMYEEDRQTALSMYNRLFDMTDDEQALLQFLVSPTRQAVVLARKYDAAERKLHVHSQHRDPAQAESADTPPFVLAIEKLEQEALSLGVTAPVVDTDQLSLFEDDVPAYEDEFPAAQNDVSAAREDAPAVLDHAPRADEADNLFSLDALDDGLAAPVREEPVALFTLDPAADEPEVPAQAEPAVAEAVSEESSSRPAPVDDAEETAAPAPAGDDEPAPAAEAEDAPPAESESAAPDPLAAEQSAPVDKVDAFLSDFSIKDDISVGTAEPSPAAVPPAPGRQAESAVDVPELDSALPSAPAGTVRKARVPLLILYVIAAVVVGLAATVVLLVPTLLSLSFAITSGACSFAMMGSAFSSFAMFADMLAVLGVALILFALALLFAWLFFWFIGGAICGLVRGLCRLGGKLCYKEVPAV